MLRVIVYLVYINNYKTYFLHCLPFSCKYTNIYIDGIELYTIPVINNQKVQVVHNPIKQQLPPPMHKQTIMVGQGR